MGLRENKQDKQKFFLVLLSLVAVALFFWPQNNPNQGATEQELAEYRNRLVKAENMIEQLSSQLELSHQLAQRRATPALNAAAQPQNERSPDPLPGLWELPKNDKRVGTMYGGVGDAVHLGGFTQNDTQGQSPSLWVWMMKSLNVRKFMDIGCGRGISTKFFKDNGAKVLCVEGSNDALNRTLLNRKTDIVQHDYSRGVWWPEDTWDVAWAVEFLEHVGRHYSGNYLATMDKAALLFLTHSNNGGYHHVEVHRSWWWKARLQARGYVFSQELTTMAQAIGRISNLDGISAQHIWATMQVYINPRVASLPEHSHLFGGPGCPCKGAGGEQFVCQCSGADALPERFLPVMKDSFHRDSTIQQVENGLAGHLDRKYLVGKADYVEGGRIGPVHPRH